MLKINIYYGGRGLIEDPTIYVMKKLTKVFEELNVQVKRYNLYEDRRGISSLPKTLKEADAVILAASVEWMGIGGLLQSFLDSCWLYGDRKLIHSLYMMPVVLSTTYGEKEAYMTLCKAWEILGGTPCNGISAYVNSPVDFETNAQYAFLIEKAAENFYRSVSKKLVTFPSSSMAVMEIVKPSKTMTLTPQESEQLSMYVSDDAYVRKQKEDIKELSSMFKGLLGDEDSASGSKDNYILAFEHHFHPISDLALSFSFDISGCGETLIVETDNLDLKCYYGESDRVNVAIRVDAEVFDRIISGQNTLQAAFMAGELTAKGDFKILRTFDSLFRFR